MEGIDAREWGRRQAALSPEWSEEKWRRVAVLLGIELTPADNDGPSQVDQADPGRAA